MADTRDEGGAKLTIGVHALDRQLRADLAEAIALLREARDEFVDDDEDLAGGIDALLARHPGPEE